MPPKKKPSDAVSDPECPPKKKRKKLSEAIFNDDDANKLRMSTVKCCLKKRLSEPHVSLPIIEEYVGHISKIMRSGSMFVNVFLLQVLEENEGVVPEFIDLSNQTFFNRCMMVLGDSFDTAENAEKQYIQSIADLLPLGVFEGMRFERKRGDCQLINEAAKLYHTNFKNHHEVNMFRRMKKYLRLRIGKSTWYRLSPSSRYQLTRYVWAEDGVFPSNDDVLEHMWWIEELRNRYLGVHHRKLQIGREEDLFREAKKDADDDADMQQIVSAGKAFVVSECEKMYWKTLVEFTYWLGLQIHSFFEETAEAEAPLVSHFATNKTWSVPVKSLNGRRAVFSIAPVCDVRRQCITLTKTTMNDIFDIPKIFKDNPADFIFRDIHRFKSSVNGWRLRGTMRTDGVSLSVIYERPRIARSVPPPSAADATRVIAIDPGTINMYFGVEQLPDGSYRTHKYRTKEYYHEGFVWESRNHMESTKAKYRDVFDCLSHTVRKTVILDHQMEYWELCAIHSERLFDCLATKKRSKLSMNVFINGSKSIDRFLLRMKGDSPAEDIVIAYGAAKFSSTIKGTLSTPTSRAFKKCASKFRTFLVDEYNTSKYCPHCSKLLDTPREPKLCCDGVTRMFDCRSVKLCTSQECVLRAAADHPFGHVKHTARAKRAYEMSRDKVGALNILRCALAELHGMARPTHLCPGYRG